MIHRLAGRIAQIGAKDLGAAFRQLEQDVAAVEVLNETVQNQIIDLLLQLHSLLKTVEARVKTFSS